MSQRWQGRVLAQSPYMFCVTILLLLPLVMSSTFTSILTKVLIYGMFAVSLNIMWGYTGLFDFGHAAYLAVAGYTTGILIVKHDVTSFWIAAPAGTLMALLVSLVFGIIALRVSGMYFVLVTLALSQLVYSGAWKWTKMTGGTDGLSGIPRPDLGFQIAWDAETFYYFVLLSFLICLFLLYRFVNSPMGHALQGIRDSELRMRNLGYNTWLYKYISFVVSGLFTGVVGVLFAYFNGLITPSHAGANISALPLVMICLGSGRVFFGPVLGAAILVFVEYYTSLYLPQYWLLILGAIFVISVAVTRGGVGIHLAKLLKNMKERYRYGSIES